MKSFTWMLGLCLLSCQPLPQVEPAKPSHSAKPSAGQSIQPLATPSPQSSLPPPATPSSAAPSNLLSENGITLRPLENLAEYWGVHLSAEEKAIYGSINPSCIDQKGNFYFPGKSGLYQFSSSQRQITQVISTKLNPSVLIDGPTNTAEFTGFHNCIVFPDQSIYFLDRSFLRKLQPDRSVVTLNKNNEAPRFSLRSMVYDALNHRLIYSLFGNGLQAWDLQTEKSIMLHQQYFSDLKRIDGFVDGELGKDAQFGQDLVLDIDPRSSRLYVDDYDNRAIRMIENNRVTTLAGNSQKKFSHDGQGQEASFESPTDMQYDSTHDLILVLDRSRIRIVKTSGEVRTLNLPGQDRTGEMYFLNKFFSSIYKVVIVDKNHWVIFVTGPLEENGTTKGQVYAVTLPDILPEIKIP
ncbi:MAG: hypothetical protein AB7I41_05695 [Candidatus Sericytochromatia bacterium]